MAGFTFSKFKLKAHFLYLLICCSFSLSADWSTPIQLSISSDSLSAFPSIASDSEGYSVAVWFDIGNNQVVGATHNVNAVNSNGQPLWELTETINSNLIIDVIYSSHAVGMRGDGTAVASWTDGTYVYISYLSKGSKTWSTPEIIHTEESDSTATTTYISVEKGGNIVVSWISTSASVGYTNFVYANIFDATLQIWKGSQRVFDGYETSSSPGPAICDINASGTAVVFLSATVDNTLLSRYNYITNTWTPIFSPPTAFFPAIGGSIVLNAAGDARFVWTNTSSEEIVYTSFLPVEQTSISDYTVLSNTAGSIFEVAFPLMTMDSSGNALAIWPNANHSLGSARYSANTNSWSSLPLLDLGDRSVILLQLAGNSNGDNIATWTSVLDDNSSYLVQAANLSSTNSSWQGLINLSLTEASLFSTSSLTNGGEALALWQNEIDYLLGPIFSSINILSYPPSYFRGEAKKNRFLTKTDRINYLFWGAGKGNTVSYNLYRNGSLIAQLSSNTLSYEDHNRPSGTKETYTLRAVSATGYESAALYITLP